MIFKVHYKKSPNGKKVYTKYVDTGSRCIAPHEVERMSGLKYPLLAEPSLVDANFDKAMSEYCKGSIVYLRDKDYRLRSLTPAYLFSSHDSARFLFFRAVREIIGYDAEIPEWYVVNMKPI